MWRVNIGAAVGLATLALGAPRADAHSLYEAKHKLHAIGYYDVIVERASLPYSFSACKHGVRYHIHMNWYGDLVAVDEVGACGGYGYRDYDEGHDRPYRWRRDY